MYNQAVSLPAKMQNYCSKEKGFIPAIIKADVGIYLTGIYDIFGFNEPVKDPDLFDEPDDPEDVKPIDLRYDEQDSDDNS